MTEIQRRETQWIVDERFSGIVLPLEKGLGSVPANLQRKDVAALGWNLLAEDVSLPAAALSRDRILHNLHWMQQFIDRYGVKLAPHGKTTMAPQLFKMQLEGGAWGITLATAQQVEVAYAHGVHRILMANQLIGKENMARIARLLADPAFEFYCLVDSAEQVELLGAYFRAQRLRLNVLIELGVEGGRAGVRDDAALHDVTAAISRWRDSIALCGIEIYEGVLTDEASIRIFLQRAIQTTGELVQKKLFDRDPVMLSGAGSAWYDVVADVFSKADVGDALDVILRPGCYLTHDVGIYGEAQQKIDGRNPIAAQMKSTLQPALQLWAYVQSVPESTRAIIGMGKRDAAFDAGLPRPALHYRPGSASPLAAGADWTLTKMMDQHAYLEMPAGCDLQAGDMIGFDISHPCLTFDKWRYVLVVDSSYHVVDLVETFF